MAGPKASLPASDLAASDDTHDADDAGSESGLLVSLDDLRGRKGLGVLGEDGKATKPERRVPSKVPPPMAIRDPGDATAGYTREQLAAKFFDGEEADFFKDTPDPAPSANAPKPAQPLPAPGPPSVPEAEHDAEDTLAPSRGRLAAMFMGVSAGAAMIVLVAGMLILFAVAITWSYNNDTIARTTIAPAPIPLPAPEPTVFVEPPAPAVTEPEAETTVAAVAEGEAAKDPTEPTTEPEEAPVEEQVVPEPRNCKFFGRGADGRPAKNEAGLYLLRCENNAVYAAGSSQLLLNPSPRWEHSDLTLVETPPVIPDP